MILAKQPKPLNLKVLALQEIPWKISVKVMRLLRLKLTVVVLLLKHKPAITKHIRPALANNKAMPRLKAIVKLLPVLHNPVRLLVLITQKPFENMLIRMVSHTAMCTIIRLL